MIRPLRKLAISMADYGYRALRPIIFQTSAQDAHERTMRLLAYADEHGTLHKLAAITHQIVQAQGTFTVGGVTLSQPLILAAGFVKGHGYEDEAAALMAVEAGENIMPGWKTMPKLVGIVEFGSFTRHPRLGNAGTVMWRDVSTRSTQNRIGLKNPGAVAAATFLKKHITQLPPQFGINIATSPGVTDVDTETQDVVESIQAFLSRSIVPNWITLNLSCPNTEDDPAGNQTEAKAERLCKAATAAIHNAGYRTPLWVKIGPDLSQLQYHILMCTFAECGVSAVVATNTIGQPTPDDATITAGVGGGDLYMQALDTASFLQSERFRHGYELDIIGCGGIMDGDSYLRYKARGINVVQYWSALVYRGPLAAAIIESELA